MTTLQEALLPCPFCGGPVKLELANITRDHIYGDRHWYGVVCRNTTNHGGTCCMDQVPSASKEAAIARWNTRTALAQQELLQKERPDFMAGYDAGMADAKRMAQQGEQPTQRQLDTAMRQWETWKAYALELQAKVVKYEGGSPMLLNAAAPAPQAQEPTAWRTEALKWIRRKAEDQRATNEQNPRHAEAYPSWGERVRHWHWLADELELEQNSASFGLEPYQEPVAQPLSVDRITEVYKAAYPKYDIRSATVEVIAFVRLVEAAHGIEKARGE